MNLEEVMAKLGMNFRLKEGYDKPTTYKYKLRFSARKGEREGAINAPRFRGSSEGNV
jgi:hypothetical protein